LGATGKPTRPAKFLIRLLPSIIRCVSSHNGKTPRRSVRAACRAENCPERLPETGTECSPGFLCRHMPTKRRQLNRLERKTRVTQA
jgi:hypothetical protein